MQGTLSAVRGNAGRGNQGGLSGGGEVALDFSRMWVAGKGMAGGNDGLLPSLLYSVFTDQEGLIM